jgi:cytochrome c oxidase subunit 4
MTAQAATSHAADFDDHGHHEHGHAIVSIWTLRSVFGALIFFTLLTAGAAYLEEFISYSFDLQFPQMVNVVVAMSIAVVKAALVVTFFMQLKYDNPTNSVVLFFTLFAVMLFLLFTLLDLDKRATIDFYKSGEIVYGGTGVDTPMPIAVDAREQAEKGNDKSYLLHEHHHEPVYSSPELSRPVTAVTLEGYAAEPGAPEGHGEAPAAPAAEGGH